MSLAAVPVQQGSEDRPPSSDSSNIPLSTKNPFRRPSTAQLSPPSMSRNPFIDPPTGAAASSTIQPDPATVKLVDDIFRDQGSPDRSRPSHLAPSQRPRHPSAGGHRSTRSGDAKDPTRSRPDGSRHRAHSPGKTHMRRNSESSVVDSQKADDERRRRERRREREARREKDGKDGKDGKETKDGKDGKPRKPRRPQGFDVIDRLDLSGIYSTGMVHHDGPFDACNPHRNKKTNGRAPMQAFHPNSANNALGGNVPRQFDYDGFHGRGAEGFADYASSGQDYTISPDKRKHLQDKVAVFINPTDRGQLVHGEESKGLGTTTFLEGAPASRSALRRESENDMAPPSNPGGLGRTKSLAMRIRGISQPRRPGERITNSPDRHAPRSPGSPPGTTQSAGGIDRARAIAQEENPFFEDTSDKNRPRIAIAEAPHPNRSTSYSHAPLTRSVTTDSTPQSSSWDKKEPTSGGLLSRMKSLKGGRRPRPEIKG